MKYSIGLIGCGRIGALLEEDPLRHKPASHMGGIQKIADNVDKITLCDIDPERLEHCRKKWSPAAVYTDYKSLLGVEKPDIAIIATWTSTHKDIALYAAQNGVKGIVLEKPVATAPADARKIIAACKKHNVKLVVNHERRWDPLYRTTRALMDTGELGALKCIVGNVLCQSAPRGSWKALLEAVGGGPLLHDGTHLVDMIRYFTGDIHTINGHVKREAPDIGVETTATALMQSKNGVNIFIEAGGMRDYFNFELDLQFERARIKVGNGIREYYTTETSKRYTGFQDLVKQPFPPIVRDSEPFSGALEEVITAIETDGTPRSSGEDGLKAMEVIFAVYHSARLGGKTVTLPLTVKGHPLKKIFQKEEKRGVKKRR